MTQNNYGSRGEISLVDLATIFARRIWLFIMLFVLFVAGGVIFAFTQDELYGYTSLYQVAEVERDKPIENLGKIIALLKSDKLPELKALYKAEHGIRPPFDVSFNNPEDTSLVSVRSEAARKSSEDVKALHGELMEHLKARHEGLLGNVRKSLERRIDSAQIALETLKQTPEAGSAVAEVVQKQIELESELAKLDSGKVLVIARESVESIAPNRKLIVALSATLGFIFAVVVVYFAEFVSIVKKTVQNRTQN